MLRITLVHIYATNYHLLNDATTNAPANTGGTMYPVQNKYGSGLFNKCSGTSWDWRQNPQYWASSEETGRSPNRIFVLGGIYISICFGLNRLDCV